MVVIVEILGKPKAQGVVVVGCLLETEVEFLLVGAEGSLDDGVLVGRRLVDEVVRKSLSGEHLHEAFLELEPVVGLDEDRLERKSGKDFPESQHGTVLVELVQYHAFLVPGEDVDDGIFKARPGKPREFGGNDFHVHLEVSDGGGVLGMHMDGILEPRPAMVPVWSYHTDFLQIAVYGTGSNRKSEFLADLLSSPSSFRAQRDDRFLFEVGERRAQAPRPGALALHVYGKRAVGAHSTALPAPDGLTTHAEFRSCFGNVSIVFLERPYDCFWCHSHALQYEGRSVAYVVSD